MIKKPDSLIFDMDGTLWDAVDTYAYCWTQALKINGIDRVLTRQDLAKYIGKEPREVHKGLLPDTSDELREKIYHEIAIQEGKYVSKMGGILYPDVIESLEKLSLKYKLYLLSNCQEGGLKSFMNFTETRYLFSDYIEYGSNSQPKHINMKTLIDRNNLRSPIYIGDTDSDRKQSELASCPFVFVSWGFGSTDTYALKFDSMKNLADYFLSL